MRVQQINGVPSSPGSLTGFFLGALTSSSKLGLFSLFSLYLIWTGAKGCLLAVSFNTFQNPLRYSHITLQYDNYILTFNTYLFNE